jgi:hypothetical protein
MIRRSRPKVRRWPNISQFLWKLSVDKVAASVPLCSGWLRGYEAAVVVKSTITVDTERSGSMHD